MQLIGYLDSPYVRRVAVTLRFLELDFTHRELSIWRDYDEFRALNPLVKVPTLICGDGRMLVDSTLIIEYLEALAGRRLMPRDPDRFLDAQHHLGVALVAMEKAVQLVYERHQRPAEARHQPWIDRLEQQLGAAAQLMDSAATAAALAGRDWLTGASPTQADISTAVAWRFTQHTSAVDLAATDYPALADYSARAEALPEFRSCPLS